MRLRVALALFALRCAPLAWGATTLTVLHTNDLHSRLLGQGPEAEYSPATTGDDETVGGLARVATLISRLRAAAEARGPVLVVCAGDFTMGTLFGTVASASGGELRLLGRLGYDAVTLGNHEFEWRAEGLGRELRAALASGERLPAVLATNLRLAPDQPGDEELERLAAEGVLRRTLLLERGGLKIGLLGLLGPAASAFVKDAAPLTFAAPAAAARAALDELRGADVLVALSHGGVLQRRRDGAWYGDDLDLAREVPELAAVVGAHTHTVLAAPLFADGRPIVQAGDFGRFVGELVLERKEGAWRYASWRLHPVDDRIPGDPVVTAEVARLQDEVTRTFLAPRGFSFAQVVARTPQDLSGRRPEDVVLANLVTDSIRAATGADVGCTGNGTIRGELVRGRTGRITVSEAFNVTPLGRGVHDDAPGYPLVKLWLTGPELKALVDIFLVAYASKGPSYFPRLSGARATYNPWRVPFDRVTDLEVRSAAGAWRSVDFTGRERYSVGCTTYIAAFLWSLSDHSQGLLTVTPRDAAGAPLSSARDAIVDGDPDRPGVQEIKEWEAFVHHLRSFPDTDGDGVADLPTEAPELTEVRLREAPGFGTLFRNATWLQWAAAGALGLALLTLALAVRAASHRLKARPSTPPQ